MRVVGLALAGVLALAAPIAAHAEPLQGKRAVAPMGPSSAIVQIWDGGGAGWHHPATGCWGGSWRFWRGPGGPIER
jgi:hypothetical protein